MRDKVGDDDAWFEEWTRKGDKIEAQGRAAEHSRHALTAASCFLGATALLPDRRAVASFVDALGPKLEILYWHALYAPAGTPKGVVDKLSGVLLGVLDDPAIIKAWTETGVAPFAKGQRSPQAAQALMQSEIARWSQVVGENNIQPSE